MNKDFKCRICGVRKDIGHKSESDKIHCLVAWRKKYSYSKSFWTKK